MEKTPKSKIPPETLSRLGKVSKKTALLLVKELDFREDLPEELEEILLHRLRFRLYKFLRILLSIKICPSNYPWLSRFSKNDDPWNNIAKRIGESTYWQFNKELENYKEKHGEDIKETIRKAKSGQNKAIYKLVKWDKAWIGINFIHAKIISCQEFDDRDFFEKLSDALRMKSGVRKSAKDKNENILFLVEFLGNKYDLGIENGFKKLHQDLRESGFFYGKDEMLPLSDYDYFMRVLRRHKMIK